METQESRNVNIKYARTLGVDEFFLALVMTYSLRKNKVEYANLESEASAKIARNVYSKHDSQIEEILLNYEIDLAKIEKGKLKLNPKNKENKTCKVCGQENPSHFQTCPVCTDVYLKEYRDDFLKHTNSCDALRILDGVK